MAQRVVIIGAGIVGANLADELLSRGWKDITVVEQGPLNMPGGSTSHAPGLVFETNSSKSMTDFAKYTVSKLLSLQKDGQSCFNQVGGLEIATTPERVEELKRKKGWAASWGVEARLLSAKQCLELYPLLNKDVVLAGLHIPNDGLALAAQAVQLLIERTSADGVKYLGNTTVTGIQKSNNNVTGVDTNNGFVSADLVVCCAGFWGVEAGKMVGLKVPLLPLAHQYAKTSPVPEIEARKNPPNSASLPILRHQDRDLYYREHGGQYGIGYYGHDPMPVSAASLGATPKNVDEKNMPSRLRFTPKDFERAWKESQKLLPALKGRGVQVADGFNGVFSFTPDGAPIVGQHPNLHGFWICEAIWVTHSAGVAHALAQVLTDGKSDIDLSECELSRFDDVMLQSEYVETTSKRNFEEVYDIIHPLAPKQAPRNVRVSPFYPRQKDLGASFLDGGAWERPHWYQSNERLLRLLPVRRQPPKRDTWTAQYESPVVAVEAWKTRTAVAMYDITPLRRIHISGPGAVDLLQRVSTSDVDTEIGAITHTLFLDDQGGIKSDIMVARLEEGLFQLRAETPDFAYLAAQAKLQMQQSPNKWVQVHDITGSTCGIGLWGPLAQPLMRQASLDDFSTAALPHSFAKKANIGGVPVIAMNISYVGEPGWELYTGAENGLRLWDTLFKAGQPFGVVPAGRSAFNSLRMETGFKFWGNDIGPEYNPLQAGLGHLLSNSKRGYIGAAALSALRQQSPKRQLRCLALNDPDSIIMGKEPVYLDREPIGYITSASFGYSVGRCVAFAWVSSGLEEGDVVEIEYFGKRFGAIVTKEPVYDAARDQLLASNALHGVGEQPSQDIYPPIMARL